MRWRRTAWSRCGSIRCGAPACWPRSASPGRPRNGAARGQGEPKYLNSPESAVFHKGRELYGLFEARQALRERGFAIVVEGYMDVVALAQSGFANAVATLGTACTPDHVAKLFRFVDSVVFSFDGDDAGRRAAARALEAALPYATDARTIRFLFLPPEHDPDSYLRACGAAAFEHQIEQALPLSQMLLAQAAQDGDLATAEGRARMLAQARGLVEAMPQGLLREQLVAELARRGGVAEATLREPWSRRTSPRSEAAAATAQSERRPAARRPLVLRAQPQTATLLDRAAWLLARHPAQWHELPQDAHALLAGQPAPYGLFFAQLERLLHEHGPIRLPALLAQMSGDDDAQVLAPLLARLGAMLEVDDGAEAPAAIAAAIERLRARALDDELKLLAESGELSDIEHERFRTLHAQRRSLRDGVRGPRPPSDRADTARPESGNFDPQRDLNDNT